MSTPAVTPNQPRPGLEKWVKRLSFIAMIGMFIVLMMGSTVTNTGSAEGCGRSWPLCQGEFIPEYAVETAIEFSHRIVTAIEGILIAAVSIGAILIRRGNRQVKVLVAVLVGTLILQSGLGAAAVMWPQSPAIMASHFGISMTCFAAIFLLTRYLYEPQSLDGDAASRKTPRRLGVAGAFSRRRLCRGVHAPLGQRARLYHLAALQWRGLPGFHRRGRDRLLTPSAGRQPDDPHFRTRLVGAFLQGGLSRAGPGVERSVSNDRPSGACRGLRG
jgi:hypothetical protein